MRQDIAVAYLSWNTPSPVHFAAKRSRWSWTSRFTVTAMLKIVRSAAYTVEDDALAEFEAKCLE
jgi:hypothetical protein